MDYTNFARSYYTKALSKLNQFSNYTGTFVNLNYSLDIPDSETHVVSENLDCLPNYQVNINSNTSYFEQFLDYYYKNVPDLSVILLGKKGLERFYQDRILNRSEEDANDIIDLYIDVCIDFLKAQGVLK